MAGPSAFDSISGYNGLAAIPTPTTGTGPQSANAIYVHIHETASKRIQTLNCLKKVNEGCVYWSNTMHFSRTDLSRMPYFDQCKLYRRAVNYLLLGLSLPPIIDINSTPFEFLRALNALLLEFESFQQVHPADGSSSSSLTRAKIPHMFKRSAHTSARTRRTSSATEIGFPVQAGDQSNIKAVAGNLASSANGLPFTSGSNASELLPGEEYDYLLTPSIPFDPDYFETFSTLCDVLIDCYARLTNLVSSPTVCTAVVGEMFSKVDSKLKKVMIAGLVRELEDASRSSVKSELNGVGRVVLGGLLG
ncbi:hypothetical protein VTO42DRAFT_6327 [Malbranchea cinnamomea]